MEDISVSFVSDIDINAEIFIEGLPGVGQVGKLVAEHMIDELGANKVAEIHSIFFPPQVMIDENGVASLAKNEIYHYSDGGKDILFLVGDFQSTSAEGHYLLSDVYLEIAEKAGVKRIYTLGGYGVGHLVKDCRVLGAVNNEVLKAEAEDAGVIFTRGEPGGGIIGASGLLLGLGAQRGMEAICLMGETSGYLVDPISATSLLDTLCRLIGVEVDPTQLQERACEMEDFVEKLKEMEHTKSDEELSYIG